MTDLLERSVRGRGNFEDSLTPKDALIDGLKKKSISVEDGVSQVRDRILNVLGKTGADFSAPYGTTSLASDSEEISLLRANRFDVRNKLFNLFRTDKTGVTHTIALRSKHLDNVDPDELNDSRIDFEEPKIAFIVQQPKKSDEELNGMSGEAKAKYTAGRTKEYYGSEAMPLIAKELEHLSRITQLHLVPQN